MVRARVKDTPVAPSAVKAIVSTGIKIQVAGFHRARARARARARDMYRGLAIGGKSADIVGVQ